MERNELMAQVVFWLYRIDGYLRVNFIDDPAWLAFMFC